MASKQEKLTSANGWRLWLESNLAIRKPANPILFNQGMKTGRLIGQPDAPDMEMTERVVQMTQDLQTKLPEIKADTKIIRDVIAAMETAWVKRPVTVLGDDADAPDEFKSSMHVALECEFAADTDLEAQVRLARQKIQIGEERVTLKGVQGIDEVIVPRVMNFCLNAPPPDTGPWTGESPSAEHANYLIWALLVAEQPGPVARITPHIPRSTTKFDQAIPSGSATEFRALLGMKAVAQLPKEAAEQPPPPPQQQPSLSKELSYHLSWKNLIFVIHQVSTGFSIELDLNVQRPLARDPVEAFAALDLWMRNEAPRQKTDVAQFYSLVRQASNFREEVYPWYACVYNTLANEGEINSVLAVRTRHRPIARERRGSVWLSRVAETNRSQNVTTTSPFCVGYLPSSVNIIATPNKLIVPEPRFSNPGQPRTLLCLAWSALQPYCNQLGLVVIEGKDVRIIGGNVPAWFGKTHVNILLSWLQVPANTTAEVYDLPPGQFFPTVQFLTQSSALATEEAIIMAGSKELVAKLKKRTTEQNPMLAFQWAVLPLEVGAATKDLEQGMLQPEAFSFDRNSPLFQQQVASLNSQS